MLNDRDNLKLKSNIYLLEQNFYCLTDTFINSTVNSRHFQNSADPCWFSKAAPQINDAQQPFQRDLLSLSSVLLVSLHSPRLPQLRSRFISLIWCSGSIGWGKVETTVLAVEPGSKKDNGLEMVSCIRSWLMALTLRRQACIQRLFFLFLLSSELTEVVHWLVNYPWSNVCYWSKAVSEKVLMKSINSLNWLTNLFLVKYEEITKTNRVAEILQLIVKFMMMQAFGIQCKRLETMQKNSNNEKVYVVPYHWKILEV